jgi:hypothetical protein
LVLILLILLILSIALPVHIVARSDIRGLK